jgi:hypothetical protein
MSIFNNPNYLQILNDQNTIHTITISQTTIIVIVNRFEINFLNSLPKKTLKTKKKKGNN